MKTPEALKSRNASGVFLAALVMVVLIAFMGIWLWRGSVPAMDNMILGPMPSEAYMPDSLARQTVGDMRKWIQNFRPSDAKRLNDAGKIVFSWEELAVSYPEQARVIDDYQEQRRVGFVEAIKQQSKPIPDRLATHHAPDTVEVKKSGGGECWVIISSKMGIEHSYLEIATPRER